VQHDRLLLDAQVLAQSSMCRVPNSTPTMTAYRRL